MRPLNRIPGGLFLWVNVTEEDVLWTPYGSKFEGERGWIKGHYSTK